MSNYSSMPALMAAIEYLPKKQQKINKIMEKERKITAPEWCKETKVYKISAPNGCEIEKVEILDGVAVVTFKEKERKLPKSWEEFCEMFPMKLPYNFAVQRHDLYSDDFMFFQSYNNRLTEEMEKFTGDRATAEAVLALCQLIQLRNCYNGDWVPDFNSSDVKYTLKFETNRIVKNTTKGWPCILTFKTEELRDEFMSNFRPIVEMLEPLYGIKKGGQK